jgi:mannose-6-phosphate isomerase-like protein (cupin superfamily)
MLVRKVADHQVKQSPWCGEIREILTGAAYGPLSVAVALDIKPTRAHFHRTFDEIYFVLDGTLTLRLHDPAAGTTWAETLAANELLVVSKGLHHGVVEVSPGNRLCVVCTPPFDPRDETTSDRI